jgi:pimeloyl-[acyl-carrier protein] methyl ester esterase
MAMTKQKHFYLLRGLVREAGHWGEFPECLARNFPKGRITTIDLPGAGEYVSTSTPLSVQSMVRFMRQKYLQTRSPDEEVILVSISLGGMIAACWLEHFAQDFHAAVLINTSFGNISPIFHRLRPGAWKFLLQVPLLKGRAREERIIQLVMNHEHRHLVTLDAWEQVALGRPVTISNALKQLFAASRFSCGSFRPQLPVLLLAATHDRMVNVQCSRAIAKCWEVPLFEHPTAGHELSNDDPQWVADQISAFIAAKS